MTVMGSDTEYLPDEITYGFVADRVLLAIGDTTGDYDRYPDGVPAKGTVKFSPERTILYTQDTPATVLPQDIECTIYHRDHPVAVNNGYEPELVGKLVDPAGRVGNVALIAGWYEAVYRLETGTAQRFRFKVLPEHTAENPLWLPSVAPLTPTPSERFVVNEQVYTDTLAARDEVQDNLHNMVISGEVVGDDLQLSRHGGDTIVAGNVRGPRGPIGPQGPMGTLELIGGDNPAITVDTSVGTRIMIGDTIVFGDTGWREIAAGMSGYLSGTLAIKREGNTVWLRLSDVVAEDQATTYSTWSGLIPNGFRYPEQGYIYMPLGQRTATYTKGPLRTDRFGGVLIYDTQGQKRMDGLISWPTTQAWPTALPGSPG